MKRIMLLPLGAAVTLLGCETFIGLGDDYAEQCAAFTEVYRDADGDGEGTPIEPLRWCGDPPPEYVTNSLDCNDASADVNTRAADDQCDDIDQDCDGEKDEDYPRLPCLIEISNENEAVTCQGRSICVGKDVLCYALFFLDQDEDGYGSVEKLADTPGNCAQLPPPEKGQYARKGGDCEDEEHPEIHPGAEELCDEVDQNCNGTVGRVYLRQTFSGDVLNAGVDEGWFSGTNSGFVQGTASAMACNRPETDVTPTEDGKFMGVGLGTCVPPNTSGELETPSVDTTGALSLHLFFHEWVDFPSENPFGVSPTVTLDVRQGSGRTTVSSNVDAAPAGEPLDWRDVEFLLGDFRGPSTSLVWSYESGNAGGWGGYGIDDVLLVDELCVDPP